MVARPVGTAAAIVEDDAGGRVFVHGNLAYAWDVDDAAARRFAAVSLMRIKVATQLEVAEAFAVTPATVRRWDARDRGDCCFGGNPKITDRVLVKLEGTQRLAYKPTLTRVGGTFHVDRGTAVDAGGAVLYRLDADYLK